MKRNTHPLSDLDRADIKTMAQAYEAFCRASDVARDSSATEDQKKAAKATLAFNGQRLYEVQRALGTPLFLDMRATLATYEIYADENCCMPGSKPRTELARRRKPKLTPNQIETIRMDSKYQSMDGMARRFGVSASTVAKVIYGRKPYDQKEI